MPIIQVYLQDGRPSDLKRQLILEITEAVNRTLDSPPETIRVLLHEMPKENWGVGGSPISDRKSNK